MPDTPGDLGTGRTFKYEWEQFVAHILDRLAALEAGGGGGGGTGLTATGQASQTDPLLDLKFSDGVSGLYYAPYSGDSADGGDLYIQTAAAIIDAYAYDESANIDLVMSTGTMASLTASTHGGQRAGLSLYQAASAAQVVAVADDDQAHLQMTLPAGQTVTVFDIFDSTANLLVSIHPNGDVETAAGVILKAPDASRHRVLVANDGTLSTEVVT